MRRESFTVDEITIPPRYRGAKDDAVSALMDSIGKIGLQTPITVRWSKTGDDAEVSLVAGLHRLEACKRLGLAMIECVVFEGDEDDARLWEIAENLHRADLTVLERSEHVAEWVRLMNGKLAQVGPLCLGGRGNQGGIRAAARDIGMARSDTQRAIKVDSLSAEAKQAAVDAGIADNQSALLRAASEPDPTAQLAAIKREREAEGARKLNKDADRIIKERRIQDATDFLAARLDVTELHQYGEMILDICLPLGRACMREAA